MRHTEERIRNYLIFNALAGIALLVLLFLTTRQPVGPDSPEPGIAAEYMEQSLQTIKSYSIQHQLNTGNAEDPRQTGLIGPEWSEITTTIGDPEAKRTTLNPNFAALIAHLLLEAGVHPGDTIAIGSSGSFPALLIASLAASKALQLHPRVILSLGSSSYGASNPDFTLWDMYRILMTNGLVTDYPIAASLGGDDDAGAGFEPASISRLTDSLTKYGIPIIAEQDLKKNTELREVYYLGPSTAPPLSSPRKRGPAIEPATSIKVFINCGGALANIGSSQEVLSLRPGLVRHAPMPDPGQRGMIHVMLEHEIPVIHLLFIKGLAQKYQLPWDPPVQPEITDQSVSMGAHRQPLTLLLSLAGLIWFMGFLILFHLFYNRQRGESMKGISPTLPTKS